MKICHQRARFELACLALDRDLPCGHSGNEDSRFLVLDDMASATGQFGSPFEPPKQNMGIKQDHHSMPHSANSAFDMGLKNAREIRIFPLSLPGTRFLRDVAKGTSRTTGCLPRAIITSVPLHASLIRRERF